MKKFESTALFLEIKLERIKLLPVYLPCSF